MLASFVNNFIAAPLGFIFGPIVNAISDTATSIQHASQDAPYSEHKIEYHRKYNGTYMLFGKTKKEGRWLLRRQSTMPYDALEWSKRHNTPYPDESVYQPCDICCRTLHFGQPLG